MDTPRYLRGITLIELLISVSVIALSLTLGIPTFTHLQVNINRGQAPSDVVSSFALARSEAARRGVPITVCASTDGLQCATGTAPSWTSGWIVFTDADMNKAVDAGTDVIIHTVRYGHTTFELTPECISAGCTIATGVAFQDNGYPAVVDIGRFRYTDAREYRVLSLSYIGRIELTASGRGPS